MEGIEEAKKSEAHLTSAMAFVEGGIQDPCDDTCSICLDAFCESNPSNVTCCKHEFHLQCILEWCQRSSQCPMCWQAISLKDPLSQELLEGVEHERKRISHARNTAIFHHPTLGDFELQHFPVGANDSELEERIIQHLAAAAAMGRRHIARREGHRSRNISHSRPQFLVFSSHPGEYPAGAVSLSPSSGGERNPVLDTTSLSVVSAREEVSAPSNHHQPLLNQSQSMPATHAGHGAVIHPHGMIVGNRSPASPQSNSQHERAGPSEFQSLSETIKSKFNAVSTRYRESISRSTRGWKEKLFSRNNTMADIGSEVRREVNAGIATVSRMMERLDSRDNNGRGNNNLSSDTVPGSSCSDPAHQHLDQAPPHPNDGPSNSQTLYKVDPESNQGHIPPRD